MFILKKENNIKIGNKLRVNQDVKRFTQQEVAGFFSYFTAYLF
jgi:hypothetical protein